MAGGRSDLHPAGRASRLRITHDKVGDRIENALGASDTQCFVIEVATRACAAFSALEALKNRTFTSWNSKLKSQRPSHISYPTAIN